MWSDYTPYLKIEEIESQGGQEQVYIPGKLKSQNLDL